MSLTLRKLLHLREDVAGNRYKTLACYYICNYVKCKHPSIYFNKYICTIMYLRYVTLLWKKQSFLFYIFSKSFLTKVSLKKGNGTLIARNDGRRVEECVWNGNISIFINLESNLFYHHQNHYLYQLIIHFPFSLRDKYFHL